MIRRKIVTILLVLLLIPAIVLAGSGSALAQGWPTDTPTPTATPTQGPHYYKIKISSGGTYAYNGMNNYVRYNAASISIPQNGDKFRGFGVESQSKSGTLEQASVHYNNQGGYSNPLFTGSSTTERINLPDYCQQWEISGEPGGACAAVGETVDLDSYPATNYNLSSFTWGIELHAGNDSFTFTMGDIYIIMYGTHDPGPEPPAPGCPGIIYDGGMEEYPTSSSWIQEDYDEEDNNSHNGRKNTMNILDRVFFGEAACGNGFHIVGDVPEGDDLFGDALDFGSFDIAGDLEQEFCWPGGNLYFKGSLKGNYSSPINSYLQENGYAEVAIFNESMSDYYQVITYSLPIPRSWTAYSGVVANLPAGSYTLKLSAPSPYSYDPDESDAYANVIFYDDIEISTSPVDPGICSDNISLNPTPTLTVTLTATPERCNAELQNCDFDDSSAWHYSNGATWMIRPPYGGVGALGMLNAEVSQDFYKPNCSDGKLYVSFWAANGCYEVYFTNGMGTKFGGSDAGMIGCTTADMQLKSYLVSQYMPTGNYTLHIRSINAAIPLFVDSVGIGIGDQYFCSPPATQTPGPSPTATTIPPTKTSTAGPSPTVTTTFTPSNTPTTTKTPTPYRTPYPTDTRVPTLTQIPTHTDIPTSTYPPTNTRPPTSTLIPTDTHEPAELTATDQGTDVPTKTPRPPYTDEPTYTPWPTNTANPPTNTPTYVPPDPPSQPPPSCYAPCAKPALSDYLFGRTEVNPAIQTPPQETPDDDESIPGWLSAIARTLSNPLFIVSPIISAVVSTSQFIRTNVERITTGLTAYMSASVDYQRCMALSYIAWCPQHSATMEALPTEFAHTEPFGTFIEASQAISNVQGIISQYDWTQTGIRNDAGELLVEAETIPESEWLEPSDNSPWNGGRIILQGEDTAQLTCQFEMESVVGSLLAQPMCFIFVTLADLGILPWMQFWVNLMSLGGFAYYVKRQWVDAGTRGT